MSIILKNPAVVFVVTLFILSSSSLATAKTVDLDLIGLRGEYQLGELPNVNPDYVHRQSTELGSPYTGITAFSRTIAGSFILPKYKDANGNIVDGFIDARQFVRDNPVSYPSFFYLFVDVLESNNYHYVNMFGTVTDFTVTKDSSTGKYSFQYHQTMSQPSEPNWIAGITTGNVFTSMWFNNYGLNDYSFLESGSVHIDLATVHFENADTPVPLPSSLFLLGIGLVSLFYTRKYFRNYIPNIG